MSAASTPPNILLITTDQQRWDTVGESKPDFLRTPHLDWLGRDGITFRRAYADCPICAPGRAAIMTGASCFTHGMGINDRTGHYFDEEGTLPSVLAQAGYQTCCVGKAHFDPQYKRHGFHELYPLRDYYRAMERSGAAAQPRLHGLGENELCATRATVPEAQTLTSWTTETAAEWLAERRDPTKPWFLWVSYSKPHPPLDPPAPYDSMYADCAMPQPVAAPWSDGDDAPWPAWVNQRQLPIRPLLGPQLDAARRAYYGLISQIDFNIGRLMAAIQDQGPHEEYVVRDNTLIAFCSDHGEMLGDHRMSAKGGFYEGSAHIPMLLRLPHNGSERHRGESCGAVATLGDLLPTFAAAAGAERPAGSDGIDLLAQAEGRAGRDLLLCGQGFHRRNDNAIVWAGVTDGRWKYHWSFNDGREQLFDLENDPLETRDLVAAGEGEAKRAELKAATEAKLAAGPGRRFLREGRLWRRENWSRPPAEKVYGAGFPGFMSDRHPSDVLH